MKTSKTLGKGWWISLGIVLVVAFLAVLIFVKPATKTPEPIAQPTTSKTEKPAGGCDVPLGDTSSKPAMPKDLRWEAAKGWTWPVSDTYGPTQDKDGYGVCFARSPLGAALAMTTIFASGNTMDAKEAIEIYVADTVGKKAALAESAPSSSAPMTPAGFSIEAYTPDLVELTVVYSFPSSSTGYVGFPSSMTWEDGDWKAKVSDNGKVSGDRTTKPVTGGFQSWGGPNV
ncbi:hypothetical protein AAFM46_16840 (plasmid) [Arthrobacter sp. TMP15]|uniref:hypothetical protein n=1 Tax=Arthrobacter sp. TMP15 TaxID=3140789 RepID=UPI0031BA073C